MFEVIMGLINQNVDFFVKLFYICLFLGILGFGFLNWLGMAVEKQRKLREGKGVKQ